MSERVKSIEEIAAEIAVKVPPEEWDKMLPDASDFIDVGDCHKEIARLRAEVERLRALDRGPKIGDTVRFKGTGEEGDVRELELTAYIAGRGLLGAPLFHWEIVTEEGSP